MFSRAGVVGTSSKDVRLTWAPISYRHSHLCAFLGVTQGDLGLWEQAAAERLVGRYGRM